MSRRRYLIDGNNLMYAMHEHAPIPHVGRETMIRHLDRWAQSHRDEVIVIFDGGQPRGDLARQMRSPRVVVKFSGGQTADDIIIREIRRAKLPVELTIVTSDSVIQHEARYRRCKVNDSPTFVDIMFKPRDGKSSNNESESQGKPQRASDMNVDEWMDLFGVNEEDLPDDDFESQMQ